MTLLLFRTRSVRLAAAAALLAAAPAAAQTVQSISPSTPELGSVVSAPTGSTVFRVSASSGAITRVSGTGVRLGTATSRALVTITCNANACRNTPLNVRVGSIGAPAGRMGGLTNFTIAAGTAVITVLPLGTNPVNFTIGGIPNGGTATFWVGMDVPILGNESASATGSANSGFYVYVSVAPNPPTAGSTAGLAVARVFRPIAVAVSSSLNFGRVTRPSSGSGTVAVNAATGQRTVTGTGAVGLSTPTPTRPTFTVSGEGGQAFSIGVPSAVQLNGPGGALNVGLTSTATGAQTLSSALGSAGTFTFSVGGSFPFGSTTAPGTYQGSYAVTVQYN